VEVLHLPDEVVLVEGAVRIERAVRIFSARFFDENFDRFSGFLIRLFVGVDDVGYDVVVFRRKRNADAGVVGNEVWKVLIVFAWNTKGGSVTLPLTSCLTGLEVAV